MPSDSVSNPNNRAFAVGAHSEIGDRSRNEDACAVRCWGLKTSLSDPGGAAGAYWLIAVADGLGGHPRGDEASESAISAIGDFQPEDGGTFSVEDLNTMFRAASERVESLHSHGRDRLGSEGELPLSAQPATTLIVATCADGRELRVANLGDSRAYVITADGQLIFASTPHNSLGGYVLKCLGDCRFEAPDVCSVRLPEDPAGVVVVCATDGCGLLSQGAAAKPASPSISTGRPLKLVGIRSSWRNGWHRTLLHELARALTMPPSAL